MRTGPEISGGPPHSRAYTTYLEGAPGGPATAFMLARETYLAGERLDMRALSSKLGVSRVTLYRWAGSREELLADVIWSLAEEIWLATLASTRGRGAPRVIRVTARFTAAIARARALRQFLEADAEVALRVLTRRGGGVQGRMVAATEALLREEVGRSDLVLRVEPEVMAYAMVRVIEAFLYNDAVASLEPDLDHAVEIIRMLVER